MRRSIFFMVCMINATIILSAQVISSADTKIFQQEIKPFLQRKSLTIPVEISGKYAIHQWHGNPYVSCIAMVTPDFDKAEIEDMGIMIGSKTANIITMRVPLEKFNEINTCKGIRYYEIATKIKPNLDKAIKDTRVDSVWNGIQLPKAFSGKDVLIGITDWGFDYTNPNFYDTTLSHTRIVKAWDQYRNGGSPPSGFSYGTEISGEINLLAHQCDTFNIYQWATHGSHVAGICGGSGAGTPYRGVAYEAEFLMATFLVDAAAVLDAYQWMYNYAQSVGKRLVINQSWGLYWAGNLDGTSLLSQAIDNYSTLGVVFVSSGGNNGDVDFHIKRSFSGITDTLKTIVGFDNYNSYSNMWGQSISMWGTPNYGFNVSINVLNTSNLVVGTSPAFATDSATSYTEGEIIIGNDTVFYNVSIDSANIFNQRPHARVIIKNKKTSTYKIALYANAAGGTLNCWNVIELTNDVGNWGSPFSALSSGWTAGDFYSGLGEPTCTKSVISIAAHQSEYKLTNGNLVGGNIAPFSSYGPTYDGRLKPDISAPGHNVCSSVSSFTNQSLPAVITSVPFNGRTYNFCRFSGTSMSSPMVTGIVALMLQANPYLSPEEIKNILIQTAREDSKTGIIPDSGSYRWGWGKVHAWKAIKAALLGIEESENNNKFIIFPNPTIDEIQVYGDDMSIIHAFNIYNMLGKEMKTIINPIENRINIDDLPSGIYMLSITTDQKIKSVYKFVKQ